MNKRLMPDIELEFNRFQDAAELACDAHLEDLRAFHARGCGELKITPSYHTKRFADMRQVGLGGSSAGLCADATHEH